MKILVISDTHGRHGNFDKMLEREGQPDMLIHLGDVEEGEDYIRAVMECPVYMVAGNNDFWSDLPREAEVRIADQKVMLTHGHAYYVSMGTERLALAASSGGAQAVFYGHTHRPIVEWNSGILVANPGSLSYPRQSDRRPSYIVIEVEKNEMLRPEIRYL